MARSIKQRWAGRCEHLTLPSSLMGTHCVLTFKFPRYLPPCLSRCFPPSCYLAVRAGDLTADLKHCSGSSVLFNDPHPLFSYLPLIPSLLICYIFHLTLFLPVSLSYFTAAFLFHSVHCFNESERGSVRVAYQYAERPPPLSAETWYLGHRNNGCSGRWG